MISESRAQPTGHLGAQPLALPLARHQLPHRCAGAPRAAAAAATETGGGRKPRSAGAAEALPAGAPGAAGEAEASRAAEA